MVLNKEEGTAHSLALAQAEENEKSGDDGFSDDESFDETAWVKGIFDDFAKGSNHIATPDFPKLLEALGLTYCEEDHRRTIKKISSVEDSITFKAFFDWYIDWMYGDGDKDEEAPKTPFTSTSAPAPVASSSAFPPMSRAAPKNSFTPQVLRLRRHPHQRRLPLPLLRPKVYR
jgi:hypothetical protein